MKNQLILALEEIVSPVKFMQERLTEGQSLDGIQANNLSNSASYLKSIAQHAINSYEGGELSNFADWILNNWLVPAQDMWQMDTKNMEFVNTLGVDENGLFTTDEIVKMFLDGNGEN